MVHRFLRSTKKKFGIVVVFSTTRTKGTPTMATRLGEKLRELRKQRGLTLEKLADISGLSKSYVWELENRESQRPSAEKLTALADALGVAAAYFIEEDVRAPEERHLDEAFFRNYQKLEPDAKEQLRKILGTFKKSS
jgi:transcriptional regulator with XRE-family HTH domain